MQLPFFRKKDHATQKYCALFLKEGEGIVLILETNKDKLDVVAKEKFAFSNGWENLVEDVDEALYKLEVQTKKTSNQLILFIYTHLINLERHEIKRLYFTKIKALVKNLEFQPLGFIEASEAIEDYLETKEESPLTGILVELDKTILTVTIFKGGQKMLLQSIARTDNIIDDLLTIFEQQKEKILLPSRIILYNSRELDDESTQILTYHWSEDIFIQLPKVEIIKEENLIQSFLNIFGGQITTKQISSISTADNKEILGFVIGEDIENSKIHDKIEDKQPIIIQKNIKNPYGLKLRLTNLFFIFLSKCVKFPLKIMPTKLSAYILVFIGLGVIVLAAFFLEFFFHKANLVVYFPAQTIKKEVNLSQEALEPVVSTVSSSMTLNDSLSTSGKQLVGDKAKGDVTLFNFDDKEIRFDKGSLLAGEGLKFILDSEVNVASATEMLVDNKPIKKPGEAKDKVTAESIGPESNLPSKKRFQINSLSTSTYFATNDTAFSGGTKKEIMTVAKKDMDDLRKKILNQAGSSKNIVDINKLKDGKKLIGNLTEVRLINEQFSKEIGEEANRLTLTSTVKLGQYFYNVSKMQGLLLSQISGDVQSGYQLEANNLQFIINKADKKGDELKLTIAIDAKATKNIPKKELMATIVFKNRGSLDKSLKEKYNVAAYKLNISNPIPFLRNWTPIFQKNINLEINYL